MSDSVVIRYSVTLAITPGQESLLDVDDSAERQALKQAVAPLDPDALVEREF